MLQTTVRTIFVENLVEKQLTDEELLSVKDARFRYINYGDNITIMQNVPNNFN